MEKFILRLFLFLFVSNSVLSQTITVIDKEKEPIYNVSFYKKDLSKGNFTNFLGEIDLSDYSDSDSIIIQHPSFEKIIILKSDIENNSIELSSKIIEIKMKIRINLLMMNIVEILLMDLVKIKKIEIK